MHRGTEWFVQLPTLFKFPECREAIYLSYNSSPTNKLNKL